MLLYELSLGSCSGLLTHAVMRSLAEGKIRWGFWPPIPISTTSTEVAVNDGPTGSDVDTSPAEGANAGQVQSEGSSDSSTSGRGIWLGDFEHEEADDLASLPSEDEDDDANQQAQSDKKKGVHDLLHEQRYASSDEDDDSEDDGEIEEVERKAKEIDKGFFAALDMGDGEDEDSDES